jgi:hypothetical protein
MWRTSLWRSQIDQVLAHRILAGDRQRLTQRLQTFAAVPQGLASLLQQLQNAVTDAERAIELHAVWPLILDALLPNVRTRDDDAYHGDIKELDQALLADRASPAATPSPSSIGHPTPTLCRSQHPLSGESDDRHRHRQARQRRLEPPDEPRGPRRRHVDQIRCDADLTRWSAPTSTIRKELWPWPRVQSTRWGSRF